MDYTVIYNNNTRQGQLLKTKVVSKIITIRNMFEKEHAGNKNYIFNQYTMITLIVTIAYM